MAQIVSAVGRGGRNEFNDVRVVQTLLKRQDMDPGPLDGICGRRTVSAIVRFQATFMRIPDGLVEPTGRTLRRLGTEQVLPRPEVVKKSVGARKDLTDLVGVPAGINAGLVAVSNGYMKQKFGNPRESYTQDCAPMTNQALKKHVVNRSVGPFKVTGLSFAVDSLATVFADVKAADPALYNALGTAGMLCCRLQRGSRSAISNHSWGTAIDLTLDGVLDPRGDGKVQFGLTLLVPYFNRKGWYWGAAFRTEDAMHFEASRSLTDAWAGRMT